MAHMGWQFASISSGGRMTAAWGIFAGGVTLAASQSVSPSGTDFGAVLIALITAGGAIGAAWVASRVRNRGRQHELEDDEVIIKRAELERLTALERRRRNRER
jgi:hypothetical protein